MVVMGRVVAPFGVRGWVKVQTFSASPENLLAYPVWLVGDEANRREHVVNEAKVQGGTLVAKLAGCDDRDEALKLRGAEIAVFRESLPAAHANEFYWSDLVGLAVANEAGENLGLVTRVFETGANDVLVVKGPNADDRERLIPFIEDVVREVNVAGGTIRVDWGADY
jgi:16S rRNA processing protein RimM